MKTSERALATMKRYRQTDDGQKATRAASKRYNGSVGGRIVQYKRSSEKRGLDFTLSRDEFDLLVEADCHYCGGAGYGIDRVNSALGYVPSNCVSCCTTCNRMKSSLSVDEFIAHVLRIAESWEVT